MKKYDVTCPYCGATAVLKPAIKVFGTGAYCKNRYLYICPNWPSCDSYVSAHLNDLSPMGTMANSALRHKRIQAHRALATYQKTTHMEKWAAYIWLEGKLGLDQQKTHIGMFSADECNRVISLCKEEARAFKRTQREGCAV